jgi:bifunctional DNA-binding transcriptional regulator/antitoxin component of YhaV-PrlF toxin-antitoxin module
MNTFSALIRQRGQLTIPATIRDKFDWLQDSMAVIISVVNQDTLTLKPHVQPTSFYWPKLYSEVKRVRGFRGQRGNLSQFIAKDRLSH